MTNVVILDNNINIAFIINGNITSVLYTWKFSYKLQKVKKTPSDFQIKKDFFKSVLNTFAVSLLCYVKIKTSEQPLVEV